MPGKSMQQQLAEMFASYPGTIKRLVELMPNAVRVRGDPDSDIHMVIGADFDSQQAAFVTLEKYGANVDRYSVEDIGLQVFIHFDVARNAEAALQFYMKLPRNMRKYKAKDR